jgi:hypothetical protein
MILFKDIYFYCFNKAKIPSRILTIIFLLTLIGSQSAYSFSLNGHSEDIIQTLSIDFSTKEGKECLKTINSYIIDDFKGFRTNLLSQNPTLNQISYSKGGLFQGYSHRILFHWGAGGKIFFGSPPLKDYFDQLKNIGVPDWEINNYKNSIQKEWHIRRIKMIKSVETFLKFSGVNSGAAKALSKPLATLVYDIHLLGDYQGRHLKGLQPIQRLNKDIIKVLNLKVFNHGRNFDNIINLLNRVDMSQPQLAAAQIKEILRTHLPEALESALGKTLGKVLVRASIISGNIAKLNHKYSNLTRRIKNRNIKTATNVAVFTAGVSSVFNAYKLYKNDIGIKDAFLNTAEETGISFGSMYTSEAIIQNIGNGKYAITAIMDKSASSITKAVGAGLNFGVATFIFDETRSVVNFVKGDMNLDEFVAESGENAAKGVVTGSACYCAVLLGATPGGIVVIGVSIGAYILTNKAIAVFKQYQQDDYLFIEDVYAFLPLEVQRRKTIWNFKERDTMWKVQKQNQSIWNNNSNDRETIWNSKKDKPNI